MRVLLWHPAALHANTLNETRNVCAALNAAKCVINKNNNNNHHNKQQHDTTQSWWCCWLLQLTEHANNTAYTQWRWPFLPPTNGHGNENGNVIEKLHKLQLHLTHTMTTHTLTHMDTINICTILYWYVILNGRLHFLRIITGTTTTTNNNNNNNAKSGGLLV